MLDILFEFFIELFLEGSIEISKNKKISKWIRYPIIAILIILFSLIIFLIFFLGIILLNESIIASILTIALGIFLLIGSIIKFKKASLKQKDVD